MAAACTHAPEALLRDLLLEQRIGSHQLGRLSNILHTPTYICYMLLEEDMHPRTDPRLFLGVIGTHQLTTKA